MSQTTGRPRRQSGVLAQHAGDATVLLHPTTGYYFTLNDVGSRTWELCDGTHTVTEMAALLSLEFDAEPETIDADVRTLIEEFVREQLVTLVQ
ncbi:MAG: PqqD family protein [Chloroflexi bacterium]|nr:PqqD family protein [Chloroflexota bacterium]